MPLTAKAVPEPPREAPPHHGRPRKPKQDHHSYRKFDYHESPPTMQNLQWLKFR